MKRKTSPRPHDEWMEDSHAAPSAEGWASSAAKVKADLSAPRPRLWPDGCKVACPRCRANALQGSSDLTLEVPSRGHVVVFRHLQGARCGRCAYQVLEPGDQHAVEEEVGVSFHADYEAKVSRIGSGTLGTYWPKDVTRVMHLEPHDLARIHVIAPDTAVVRFEKPGHGVDA